MAKIRKKTYFLNQTERGYLRDFTFRGFGVDKCKSSGGRRAKTDTRRKTEDGWQIAEVRWQRTVTKSDKELVRLRCVQVDGEKDYSSMSFVSSLFSKWTIAIRTIRNILRIK